MRLNAMANYLKNGGVAALLTLTFTAEAEWSSTVTLASDYSFNGVSQTDKGPALQASLDYSSESGWYLGSFASNVDFGDGDDTWLELDGYAGYFYQFNEHLSLDAGLAYYSYHGESFSDDYNYPEAYAKWGYQSPFGQSELNLWYSWDYFGTGAGHSIVMLAHSFELAPGHRLRLSFDRSTSDDTDKWQWQESRGYQHYRIAYQTQYHGIDIELAGEDTSLDSDNADARLVLSLSHRFTF
ncbi:MAG: TorF family putative porin [Shewanella algae]